MILFILEMYALIITPLPHIDPVLCGLAKATLWGKQGRRNHFHAPHGGSSPEKLRSSPHWESGHWNPSLAPKRSTLSVRVCSLDITRKTLSPQVFMQTQTAEKCASPFTPWAVKSTGSGERPKAVWCQLSHVLALESWAEVELLWTSSSPSLCGTMSAPTVITPH